MFINWDFVRKVADDEAENRLRELGLGSPDLREMFKPQRNEGE